MGIKREKHETEKKGREKTKETKNRRDWEEKIEGNSEERGHAVA
jgi:hypothetical protein